MRTYSRQAPQNGADGHYAFGERLKPGDRVLADYAASMAPSRGRKVHEEPCPSRNDMQRDRDRILHSTSFRRLTYKTQMFVYHEGDHYRTRLTHSLEVAQIARTIARQLCLDEDLSEAIALGHDLGHPPFGHAGERALDAVLAEVGGFDHNVQSFRLVTAIERKYHKFNGLNLTWETLEGLAKHNGPPALSGELHDQRLIHAVRDFEQQMDLQLDHFASGEAQAAALADDIAWHTHDIDDGLRAGLLVRGDLREVPLVRDIMDDLPEVPAGEASRDVHEIVRRLIAELIADVVRQSRQRLSVIAPKHPDEIRNAGLAVVAFSEDMEASLRTLRDFLFARLYHHPAVINVMRGAEQVVQDLVRAYAENERELPSTWQSDVTQLGGRKRMRRIADFVAGMTDRFAIAEHQRLFDVTPQLS